MRLAQDDLDRIEHAMAAAPTPPRALAVLLTEARRLTRAQAGTVYLRRGDELHFAIVQNDVLTDRLEAEELQRRLATPPLTLEGPSIAGYVALMRAPVNIPDVYEIPLERPYAFDRQRDAETGYRTCSMVALPLRDPRGRLFGVLQLINALDDRGEVVPFDQDSEDLAAELLARLAHSMLASQARPGEARSPAGGTGPGAGV